MLESETHRLAAAFLARTLPKADWTHHAHIRVGLWHVMSFGPDRALSLLRERIRLYNESCGVENSDTSGYHETITQFYVVMITQFLKACDLSQPIDDLADALISSLGDESLPLNYWSRDVLMSPEARREWVEPDLKPLD